MVKLAARPLKPSPSEALLSMLDVPELTPRSSMACKLHAVDPRELLPLAPEAFKTPGETKDEQLLRYSAYEAARVQTYRLVQIERQHLLFADTERVPTSPSKLPDVSVTRVKAFDMERERRALERMRIRQKDDIELMLLNELRLTKMKQEEQVGDARWTLR
jgi:hypothetical protein